MSAEPIELASTYVSVGISTEGLGRQILKQTKGLDGAFAGLGKKSGSAYSSAFATASGGATKGAEKDQDALARSVQTAVGKVRTARDSEAAATRKVAIEEAKLTELRDAGAKDSQILQAEDRLATARVKQAVATERVKGEVSKLETAQRALKTASQQSEQAATGMATKVKTAFSGITSPFDGLGAKAKKAAGEVGQNLASSVRPAQQAFGGFVTKARTTASQAGSALATGVSDRANALLGRLDPFVSLVGRARTSAVNAGSAFAGGVSNRARAVLSAADPFVAMVGRARTAAVNAGTSFGTAVTTRVKAVLAPLQPFAPVISQARTAAMQAGSNLAAGIMTRVKTGLAALNPLAGLSNKAKPEGDEAGTGFVAGVRAKLGALSGLNPFSGLSPKAKAAGDDAGEKLNSGIGGKIKGGVGALGSWLKLGLIGAMAGAGAAIGAQLMSGIRGASDLEQSVGGVQAVFGQYAGQIEDSSKKAALSLGMSRNAYNELATVVGAGLKNKGIKDYAGETQKLLGLGADLAAQFGGSTQEAVEAISSLMRGEADPIERYGIAINETAVSAELAARGQDKLTGAALEQAKAQARVDLLMRQSADAQGAFAREYDTFAGKQQRAAAQWEDLKTKIGGAFLPVLTQAMGFISATAIPALESLGTGIQGIWSILSTGEFKGAALTFGLEEDSPVIGVLFAIRDGFVAVQTAMAGVASSPQMANFLADLGRGAMPVLDAFLSLGAAIGKQLGPILTQVGALVTTVILPAWMSLWQAIATYVLPAFAGIVTRVTEVVNTIGSILGPVITTIVTQFQALSPQINVAMTQVGQIIAGVMNFISATVGFVLNLIRGLWSLWGDNILAIIRLVMNTAMGIIRGVLNIIQGIINVVMGVITGDWSRAWQGIRQIFDGIWQVIVAILRGAVGLVVQVISAAWDLVRGLFSALGTFLAGLWRGLWDGLLAVGRSVIGLISGAIDAGLGGIRGFFAAAVDFIRTVWSGLREAAAAPVRFVINTVINDGIIKGWNDLVGLLKLDSLRIGRISVPGLYTGGRADIVPGSRARGRDSTLAVTSSGTPIARVDPGEGIIRHGAMRSLDSFHPGAFEYINATGRLPAFFLGGRMPVPPGRISQHRSGYSFANWAGDLARPMGTPVTAWRDGTVGATARLGTSYGWHVWLNHPGNQRSLYAHLSQIAVQAGQQVAAGQLIGRVGSTGNSRGPHLHFEVRGGQINAGDTGGGGGAGLFDAVGGWITDKLASPVRALLDRVPGAGVFADVAKGVGTKLLDSALEKIRSVIPNFGDGIMSGAAASASWVGNANLLMQAGRTLGLSRHAMKIALMTAAQESSMGTNRTAMSRINRDGDVGWFQQRATRGDGTVAQLADPLYGLSVFIHGKRVPAGYHVPGLYNIRGWQGMPLGTAAQRVQVSAYPRAYDKWADEAEAWLRGFGYAGGTYSATPGWHLVGEQGAELVKFRGGEQVATSPTTKEVLDDMGSGDGVKVTVIAHDPHQAAQRVVEYLRWGGGR